MAGIIYERNYPAVPEITHTSTNIQNNILSEGNYLFICYCRWDILEDSGCVRNCYVNFPT
jgi:hypothetical protein